MVATRTSSIPEIVGGMAPLVDPLSPDLLAALAKCLTNPHASNPLTLVTVGKVFYMGQVSHRNRCAFTPHWISRSHRFLMTEITRTLRPLSAVRIVRGAGYVTASTLVDRLLTIGTTVVLVRIVSPSTIGLVLLATTVTEVVALLRPGGTGFALIHQGHQSGELLRSALLIQVGLGVIAWMLQLSLATLIASVFRKPDLASVLIVLSFTHLPSAVLVIVQAILSIEFDFGRLSWVTLAPAIIGSSAQVMFALAGGGAEGIGLGRVLGQYSGVTIGILLIGLSRIMTGRFSRSAVNEIFRFGKHVFAADSLSYLSHNLDYLMLGRMVSSASLGAYGMAYNMAMLPITTINVVAGRLMMPMFADAQVEPRLLKERGKSALLLTGLICLPMTAAIAIPAQMIVDYVLGDGWSEMVLPLRLLAIYAAGRSVASLGGVAANAVGHPEVVARFNYVYTPASVVAIAGEHSSESLGSLRQQPSWAASPRWNSFVGAMP